MNSPAKDPVPELQRHALLVEYNGSAYCGSQYQEHHGLIRPTVQQALQMGLEKLQLKVSAVNLCSRTDTGVHARGQVAHFDLACDALTNIDDLAAALNAVLPGDITIKAAALNVGRAFHSRSRARRKWYRYRVLNRPQPSALAPLDAFWWRYPLDEKAMDQAAQTFIGPRNFKSFKNPDTKVVDDICHVEYARVTRDGEMIHFDIVATRFLYKMVRNLMGLLLAVGRNRDPVSLEKVEEILEKQDPIYAQRFGPTAKASGLTLMAIDYPDDQAPFKDDELVRALNQLVTMEFQPHENLFRKAS